MSNQQVTEIDAATGHVVVRDANNAELAQAEQDAADKAAADQAAAEQDAARQSALAKLSALGLTDAEIAALIGG